MNTTPDNILTSSAVGPEITGNTAITGSNSLARMTRRIPFLRTEVDRLLMLSMLFSCLLTAARILYTDHLTFIFLPWNLFLAFIPYAISTFLTQRHRRNLGWWFSAIIWLLFIPNAFYITTDLYHLADRYNDHRIPQWFDLTMILSYAWNGLLLGVLSVRHMERMLVPRQSLRNELLFLYPVMWLNALGIYIGRYLRYNSWDVVTDPLQLLRDIAVMMVHPLRHQNTWDMVLCFSILMTLIYLMMKKVSKALN